MSKDLVSQNITWAVIGARGRRRRETSLQALPMGQVREDDDLNQNYSHNGRDNWVKLLRI